MTGQARYLMTDENERMHLISDDDLHEMFYHTLGTPTRFIYEKVLKQHAPLNKKEQMLAAKLLEYASEVFGSHSCNDLPEEFWEGWTQEERIALYKEYEQWNSGGADYQDGWTITMDWMAMGFMAYKLGYIRPPVPPVKMLLTNEEVRGNSQLVEQHNQKDAVRHRCLYDGENFLVYKHEVNDGVPGWRLVFSNIVDRDRLEDGEYPDFVPERG
jgi:hypothetical protein